MGERPVFKERRFKWLLRLLPASFREEHEREILRVWREEATEAACGGGSRVWADALKDTMRVAPREHAAIWTRNLKFAVRSLRRCPGFAITAVVTLALGTGATAAVFTLVNAVLLRSLPWAEPDRVGIVWPIQPSGERTWLSFPELGELQREISGLHGVAGFTDLRPNLVVDGVGQEVQALAVSHRFLNLLGVGPLWGRDFSPEDDRDGAAPTVILSHAFWRTQFGGDPSIVGRLIRLDERDYSVVGVLPSTFAILPATSVLPERVDVWVPLEGHLPSRDRSVRFLHVLARLRPGATFAGVSGELDAYGTRVTGRFPTAYQPGAWRFSIHPFKDDVLKSTKVTLYLIAGLVLLVLLMACSNVANLLLARSEARRSELAVRAALGAGPARLAGELLSEALVLSALGSTLGLSIAVIVPKLLVSLDPGALPRLGEAQVDRYVAMFAVGLMLLVTAIFAFAPMLERLGVQSVSAAMTGRNGGRSRRSVRIGRTLVVFQTALATTVLITTCFLMETFVNLRSTELGFAPGNLLTARINLSPKYDGTAAARFFSSATSAVGQISGVIGAGAVTQLPLSGAMLGSTFQAEPASDGRRLDVDVRGVTPNYFDVIGTPVVQGRPFNDLDASNTPQVAVVDEAFARRMNPDGQVIGRTIRWIRQPGVEIRIVGVVRSIRHRSPADPPRETVYRPHRQYSRSSMFLAVRTSGDPTSVTAAVRAAVASIDPAQPFADVSTMQQRLARSLSRSRTSLLLAGALAALALGLALIGLYGVLSFGVARRRREFGIRLSLGSTPGGVSKLVLSEGLRLTLAGIASGVVGASIVAALIESALYGTRVTDGRQYLLGIAVVVFTSLVAFWIPAHRASTTDPLTVLRAD